MTKSGTSSAMSAQPTGRSTTQDIAEKSDIEGALSVALKGTVTAASRLLLAYHSLYHNLEREALRRSAPAAGPAL
jgi:hypothetical protein